MNKFQKYIQKYEEIHTGQKFFTYIENGETLPVSKRNVYGDGKQFVKKIFPYVDYTIKKKQRAISILDYGCGKAKHTHDISHVNKMRYKNFRNQTIFSFFDGMIQSYYCYDPCVPKFSVKPSENSLFDFIGVADVMEHIPEEFVDEVLQEINTYCKNDGLIVFTISGNKAIAHFSEEDGQLENAHTTVMPFSWWRNMLKKHMPDKAFVLLYSSNEIYKQTNRLSDTRICFQSSLHFQVQKPVDCKTA